MAAPIYMTNPDHGAMHVYSEAEARANEINGWVRSKEPTAAEIVALKAKQRLEQAQAEVARLEAESAPEKRGPGRPRIVREDDGA